MKTKLFLILIIFIFVMNVVLTLFNTWAVMYYGSLNSRFMQGQEQLDGNIITVLEQLVAKK